MPGLSDPLLIKKLFGRATRCAYPNCNEELIFEDRGMLTPNVAIAHIRSKKIKGPRYDPNYPKDLLDTEENLLLLCGKHHKPVDDHASVYRTGELLEWKRDQVSKGSVRTLSDAEVAQISVYLKQLTQADLRVEAVGVAYIESARISVPLNMLAALPISVSERFLGVTVTNDGLAPATIRAAGIDLGVVHSPLHMTHLFDDSSADPCITAKSSSTWCTATDTLVSGIVKVATENGVVPKRFRPYARPDSGDRAEGAWQSIVDLPIWKSGMTEDKLDDLIEKAAVLRRR
ncbi:HNH endonuclease signature motif containing protein [Nocardia sp. NPDC050413]|uniref:HNH endonuclease signature motif containing protein n=1 Tax=Nocardia sp. NPDC050413 TaxID=3155784 RepID=UPI0033D2CA64